MISPRNNKVLDIQEIELCLCPVCAAQFFQSSEHVIRRKDMEQTELDTCTYCDIRSGYDFIITSRRKRMGDDKV